MAQQESRGEVAGLLRQGLRAVGLGMKLLPSAMYHLTRGHRHFSRCFVQEALQCGIPEEAAREMAGELRPMKLFKTMNAMKERDPDQ